MKNSFELQDVLTDSRVVLTGYEEESNRAGRNGIDNPTFQNDEKPNILYLGKEKYVRHRSISLSPMVKEWIKEKTKKNFTKKLLYKRVPILGWLPQYNSNKAVTDLIAGVTVGLTVIPQAIACANIAGVPPHVGLYSSFMACFVYTIFGSCKDSPIGPTALTSLFVRENIHNFGLPGAVLLCFLTGCVELLMGILQLGFLIDFISGPVSIGFTSAASIIIATTQVKDVVGLSYPGGNFLLVWRQIFEHYSEIRLWDTILGVTCMVVLFSMRKMKDFEIGPKEVENRTKLQNYVNKAIWLTSISRNIIVVIVCCFMAYIFELYGKVPFVLTGNLQAGLPPFSLPPFSTTVENETYNFWDMSATLGAGIFLVPLVGILENIALAKAFSEGKAVDANQEMMALGACNVASSFVSSMSVTAGLSRGAVNHGCGVQTTFGGVYTGIIVLLALQFLMPYFYYIPRACLAAVLIASVILMVEFHVLKPIWQTKKTDIIAAVATFFTCLAWRLEMGILIGIGINFVSLLYGSARPTIRVDKTTSSSGVEYLLITPDRSLIFPSVEYMRSVISKAGVKQGSNSIPVVIDASHIQGADFTAASGIKSLIDDFVQRQQPILFYNLKPSVIAIFQGVKPREFIYCQTPEELDDYLRKFGPEVISISGNVMSQSL